MRARIVRILVSFAAVFSAYLVYALLAVRVIEPTVAAAPKSTRTAEDSRARDQKARDLANQAAMQLRPYFPPDAWELKNPKIIGNDRVKVLVSEYTNKPGGIMELKKCTVLFFEEPNPNKPKMPPLILQAPEGADLQFDEEFDLKRAKMGQLVGGKMKGRVTISRQPSAPGVADDVKIVGHDFTLVDDQIVSPHVVDFRFGQSYGSGRDMTILLERGQPPAGKPGKTPTINGVKSLTLKREVSVHMVTAGDDKAKLAPPPAAPAGNPFAPAAGQPQPPVKITCQGPFYFDMDKKVATFNEKVDVFRLNPNAPSDQMNCEMLAVHFAEREKPDQPPGAKAAPKRAASSPQSLEARWIEARGDPVIIRAPSQGEIRSQRVEYDLKTGQIILDGPGTLHGASPNNPTNRYFAQWATRMSVVPLVGEQLVTLSGGATVKLTDMGTRTADGQPQSGTLSGGEIKAWLATPPDANAQAGGAGAAGQRRRAPAPAVVRASPPAGGQDALGLEQGRLKRVLAQGAVRVESPQLTGTTGHLDAIFVSAPAVAAGGPADQNPNNRSTAGPGRRANNSQSQQQFWVSGSEMEIHFTVRGAQTTVTEVFLNGNAKLTEAKTVRPEDKPWKVTGDRLEVVRADAPDTHVVVIGKPGHVEARGLTLSGPEIQFQRDINLLWIDGPGLMIGPAPANQSFLGGQPQPPTKPSEPGNIEVTWSGRMQFDGLTAHFERAKPRPGLPTFAEPVVARTATMMIRCETLDAVLQKAVNFSEPPKPNQQTEPAALERLVCRGGPRGMVEMENRSTDEKGLASIAHLEALDLTLNRTTGAIDAHGPGTVTSVRRGAMAQPQGGPAGAKVQPVSEKKPAAGSAADPDALSFLAVKFARAISGNMYKRELTFTNQVKSIYGPVPRWDATLDVENPDLAGPRAMALTCDSLTVREAPGRQGNEPSLLELETNGNTQAEGMGFMARSQRLTYSQEKSLVVFMGDGGSDASVFRQETVGGPTSTTRASRILFWTSTSRIEVDSGRFFDLGPTKDSPARRDSKSQTK